MVHVNLFYQSPIVPDVRKSMPYTIGNGKHTTDKNIDDWGMAYDIVLLAFLYTCWFLLRSWSYFNPQSSWLMLSWYRLPSITQYDIGDLELFHTWGTPKSFIFNGIFTEIFWEPPSCGNLHFRDLNRFPQPKPKEFGCPNCTSFSVKGGAADLPGRSFRPRVLDKNHGENHRKTVT